MRTGMTQMGFLLRRARVALARAMASGLGSKVGVATDPVLLATGAGADSDAAAAVVAGTAADGCDSAGADGAASPPPSALRPSASRRSRDRRRRCSGTSVM